MTQDEFIVKMKKFFKYVEYSNANYSGSKKLARMYCDIHGIYERRACDLINGKGCQKCSMIKSKNSKRFSKDMFISSAINKWGDKYDYSLIDYINMRTKVKIIFNGIIYEQTPANHLKYNLIKFNKKSVINKEKRIKSLPRIRSGMNTDKFISMSTEIWGNKYDYSLVDYKGMKTRIKIIFNGIIYEQTPDAHLLGRSVELRTLSTDIFIQKSKKRFGLSTFDYSKTKFVDVKKMVTIICPDRGEFDILPNTHIKSKDGYHLSWLNTYDFIKRSELIHDFFYDYSITKIGSYKDITTIICPKHGEFSQKVMSHLSGRGCQMCSRSKGELAIIKYLSDAKINYECQKKFKTCKNINELPFDFWLPMQNTIIEFDGKQHFVATEYFGGIEAFNKIKTSDAIKNKWCIDNKVNLIRIPYYDIDQIGLILDMNL